MRSRDVVGENPGGRSGLRAMASRIADIRLPDFIGQPRFWLTVAMVVMGAVLHYASPLPWYDENGPFRLTVHGMDRVLLMVPVVYAGFIFGPRGGFATLLVVTGMMLPEAILLSPNPSDSLLEISSIVLVSSLIILWFGGQQREKERRLEVLSRLEVARQELASQVEIITKNERRLAAINEVCSVVTQSLDLPHILQRILDNVVDEMGVAVALIFLKDKITQRLELVAHVGVSDDFATAMSDLRVGEGFNGRVIQSGGSMVVDNASADSRLSIPQVRDEGLQSQLIVPLRSKGVTTGSLCVATRSNRRFTTDDVELLAAIGSQVGMAIENARLYQDALMSEERYRDLFANATVAIFVQNLDGLVTAANNACTTLTGYPLEDLIGMHIGRLFAPQSHQAVVQTEQRLLAGEAMDEPYDARLIRKDGGEPILSLTTRLVSENGRPMGFQHIAIDVTERRRMRDTLNYYVRQVLTAQEEERKRIARELHDETAQSLLLILQRMDALASSPGREISRKAKTDLEQLRSVVLQTLGDLRRLTHDLRPQILDDLGLVAAVEWLAEDMERRHGVNTLVEVIGHKRQLATETQLLLFRIAQEAMSNVRRHSGATAVRVLLEFAPEKTRIVIEDNGHGFEIPTSMSQMASEGKLGLLGMSERARLAGGSLSVQSKPGKGTSVVAELAG